MCKSLCTGGIPLLKHLLPFSEIIRHLTPFFVSRQVITGSGRVGRGQDGRESGFQLGQRADFFEVEVGLETTLKRPIINTRDEPHADPAHYRRLHVIVGDACHSRGGHVDRLSTVPGVSRAALTGGRRAAMRIWLDRQALAARSLTAVDVENALRREGFGRIAGTDEVGRGCLAGPVVAAAVVLDPARQIPGHKAKRASPPPHRLGRPL